MKEFIYLFVLIVTFRLRVEKEKAKFQQEVYELLAQVESATKDRVINELPIFSSHINRFLNSSAD